ncbi:hypothetical protein O181_024307 [Austropuccinia psidii MF-1]|uniref:Cytochrome P450 n=1 Tax=Austropuccinia psidii MF-1 TaxID=1389203 RepID=A0A9Q3CLA4_9BASI|nr:hypothetical protein [Austropuccinia psidii MF-1]
MISQLNAVFLWSVLAYLTSVLLKYVLTDLFGNGIFVSDDVRWKKARQSTVSIFSKRSFQNIMEPSCHRTLDELIQHLHIATETSQEVDLCQIFFKFTLESFVLMTFGKALNLLNWEKKSENNLSEIASAFVQAFDFVQEHLDFRVAMSSGWKIVETLNPVLRNKMISACQVMNSFTYSLIEERQESFLNKNFSEKTDSPQDLLGLFITFRDDLSRTELRDVTLNLLAAGRDTTGEALSWCFYHLIRNPDIMAQIREETYEILGDEGDNRKPSDCILVFPRSDCALTITCKRINFKHDIIYVEKNIKFALRDDKIPGGPIIKAGDGVRWSDWTMARDPEIWGEDCVEYRPRRWIDESGKIKQFGQWKFHAFSGGPRTCPGMNLATFEAVSVIVGLLENFDIKFFPGWLDKVPKVGSFGTNSPSYPIPKYRSSLTHPMAQPMLVSIKSRKQTMSKNIL